MKYIVRGADINGKVSFYTGKAGEGWVHPAMMFAFRYDSRTAATRRAINLNRMTKVHTFHFIVLEVQA